MNPETFNPNIAHIADNGNVFQILTEDGTDLDEAATASQIIRGIVGINAYWE